MAYEPGQGYSYTKVQGGTSETVVRAGDTYLKSVVVGGTYVGTLVVYDCATVAGTSATVNVLTLLNPLLMVPNEVELGLHLRNGLTYVATGTPLVTIIYN
jgi:hypothetical protein